MQRKSNYQDLLKVLALLVMLIDHYGLYLAPSAIEPRLIGRAAMPIFAFYAGYNFSSSIKHIIWVLGLVIISAEYRVFGIFLPNILISLSLGQLYLSYMGQSLLASSNLALRHFLAMLIFTIFSFGVIDYGTQVIAFMIIGHLHAAGKKDTGMLLLAGLSLALFNQYTFLSLPGLTVLHSFLAVAFTMLPILLLYFIDHKKQLKYNINLISRNMLYIYTLTTLGYIAFAAVR